MIVLVFRETANTSSCHIEWHRVSKLDIWHTCFSFSWKLTRCGLSAVRLFKSKNYKLNVDFGYFYFVGLWVIALLNISLLIGGLAIGLPSIIVVSVITLPISTIMQVTVLRYMSELMVVHLLLPIYSRNTSYAQERGIVKIWKWEIWGWRKYGHITSSQIWGRWAFGLMWES